VQHEISAPLFARQRRIAHEEEMHFMSELGDHVGEASHPNAKTAGL
jgi:hypothetical protein